MYFNYKLDHKEYIVLFIFLNWRDYDFDGAYFHLKRSKLKQRIMDVELLNNTNLCLENKYSLLKNKKQYYAST